MKWRGGELPKFYAELTGTTTDLADLQPMDPTNPVYVPPNGPQIGVTDGGAEYLEFWI